MRVYSKDPLPISPDVFTLYDPQIWGDGRPILAFYEQRRSMKYVAEIAQWSKADIENLFGRNAATAFKVQFTGL